MESDTELDEIEDCTLMHHIVLPRVLPKKMTEFATELEIMRKMVGNVRSLAEHIPNKTVDLFFKLQSVYYNCIPRAISNVINNLAPGDTFAMFVRHQGCAIMIHVPSNERVNNVQNVIVATFPGSLDPSEIYRHDSGIEVCPLFIFHFPFSMNQKIPNELKMIRQLSANYCHNKISIKYSINFL